MELPPVKQRIPELIPAATVIDIIRDTEIELAVLLAAWLSFSMSEVRGLTKSKSISGENIRINEVVIDVNGKPVRKNIAKNQYRHRTHHIPAYIKKLIDKVEGDAIIDNYFENIVNPEAEGLDRTKYEAWLTLFEKEDTRESKKEFLKFINEQMHHSNKKTS